jgi:hypothetical protein
MDIAQYICDVFRSALTEVGRERVLELEKQVNPMRLEVGRKILDRQNRHQHIGELAATGSSQGNIPSGKLVASGFARVRYCYGHTMNSASDIYIYNNEY